MNFVRLTKANMKLMQICLGEKSKKIGKREKFRGNGIKSSIPRNMSREAIDRTSPSVSKILYQGYVNDVYSKLDIARHLNVGQNRIDKFLREVSKWNR